MFFIEMQPAREVTGRDDALMREKDECLPWVSEQKAPGHS
jgi:hypothetical protein